MQVQSTIFPEKRRRRSRVLSKPPEDTENASLRQMVLALQSESRGWQKVAQARSGYWLDDDVAAALQEITEARDAADRRAIDAFQQAEDARAETKWLRRRYQTLLDNSSDNTDAIMALEEENRLLRARLKAEVEKNGGDKLRYCKEITRPTPIEDHRCNYALPKYIKDLVRENGCRPEPELGAGEITLVTCEAIRLMNSFEKTDGCWNWVGKMNHTGYGHHPWAGNGYMAHRFMYTLMVGLIPFGMTIDHLCRNRGCVRPDHLDPVTQGENRRRVPTVRKKWQALAGVELVS